VEGKGRKEGEGEHPPTILWSTSPRLTLPPYWNRTILSPFLAMKLERGEGVHILSDSSDNECVVDHQEVLKMSISII
jgi:hypothetical protein